jgi:hypothetical protein
MMGLTPQEVFMERKYRQRGYRDRDSDEKKRERTERPAWWAR